MAHTDCILLYDCEGKPVVYLKDKKDADGKAIESARKASAYLYVGIERNLLDAVDPVLQAAIGRLENVYSETFWQSRLPSSTARLAWPWPNEGLM